MFRMSYRYISSSSTTTSRFRFSRTASTADGNVSSQIVEDLWLWLASPGLDVRTEEDLRALTFVFRITRRRGDKTRATRDVENIISIIETLSSSLLKAGRNSGSLW